MELFKIGEVAKITGVSESTLRRYEQGGIFIPESRTPKNHRRYSKEQIETFLKEGVKRANERSKPAL